MSTTIPEGQNSVEFLKSFTAERAVAGAVVITSTPISDEGYDTLQLFVNPDYIGTESANYLVSGIPGGEYQVIDLNDLPRDVTIRISVMGVSGTIQESIFRGKSGNQPQPTVR